MHTCMTHYTIGDACRLWRLHIFHYKQLKHSFKSDKQLLHPHQSVYYPSIYDHFHSPHFNTLTLLQATYLFSVSRTHEIVRPVAAVNSPRRSDNSEDLFFVFFQQSPSEVGVALVGPAVSSAFDSCSKSYLRGPLIGEDHQIWRFGVCLLITQTPFLIEFRSMVNIPWDIRIKGGEWNDYIAGKGEGNEWHK